jgi:Glucose / Sorbosone dehydrogenase
LLATSVHLSHGQQTYTIERIAFGLDQPVSVAQPAGEPNSLYVLERLDGTGVVAQDFARITVLDLTTLSTSTLMTIPARGGPNGGAHALAFHPNFQSNHLMYVSIMVPNPAGGRILNQVQEYLVPEIGEPTLQRVLISYPQNLSSAGHGIDWIGFGPDAEGDQYLHIFTGDGGPQADHPAYVNNSQLLDNPYGKVLRVDVDGEDAYPDDPDRNFAFPPTNPFIDGDPATFDEILHYGLRNPWRGGIDRVTGDLTIGDVGFFTLEELNFARVDRVGVDFGWAQREGTIEGPAPFGGPQGDSTNPVFEYDHNTGSVSITGGPVYRGPVIALRGRVFFADFQTGRIWSGSLDRDAAPALFDGNNLDEVLEHTTEFQALLPKGQRIDHPVSIEQDVEGNLYICDMSSAEFLPDYDTGEVYRLVPVGCASDRNGDGFIDFFDVLDFLGDFASHDPSADINGDLEFDFFDVQAFL